MSGSLFSNNQKSALVDKTRSIDFEEEALFTSNPSHKPREMDNITIDSKQVKQVLRKLEDAKQSVEDLIDTFQLLQDPEFTKELDEALDQANQGKTTEYHTVEELRKQTAGE